MDYFATMDGTLLAIMEAHTDAGVGVIAVGLKGHHLVLLPTQALRIAEKLEAKAATMGPGNTLTLELGGIDTDVLMDAEDAFKLAGALRGSIEELAEKLI